MNEPIVLTDSNLDTVLNATKPALILFTTGDGLRGDFKVNFNKMAGEKSGFVFATLDPTKNPQAAAQFGVGDKPVLMAWYCGEEIARRSKPWGTDLQLALDMLERALKDDPNAQTTTDSEHDNQQEKQPMPVNAIDKPVAVTDATFELEVLESSSDMPILVDFWAAWCGPCRMVAPILDKLAGEFAGQIKIAKVDTDANMQLSQAFNIRSIPTLMIVKNRTIIFNQPGALPEPVLRDLVQQAIAIEVPPPQQQPEAQPKSTN